jgi:two-component sensor histidine kinase
LDFYGVEDRISVHIESQTLLLGIDQAIPCGLIVNELLTNSFKHGFPNGRTGAIRIALHPLPDGERELSVTDDGVGIPQDQGWSRPGSLGLRLVRDLVRQLDGRISMESKEGTRVRIVFGSETS